MGNASVTFDELLAQHQHHWYASAARWQFWHKGVFVATARAVPGLPPADSNTVQFDFGSGSSSSGIMPRAMVSMLGAAVMKMAVAAVVCERALVRILEMCHLVMVEGRAAAMTAAVSTMEAAMGANERRRC